MPFWTSSAGATPYTAENSSFQIVFAATDSSITFVYQDMATAVAPEYAASTSPVVVGIENSTGDIGTQISSTGIPADNSCVKFDPPNVPLIEVVDVFPQWNQTPNNGGFFVFEGDLSDLTSNIKNGGSVDVSSPIAVTTTLVDSNGELFGEPTVILVPSLDEGQSTTITVWEDFPGIAGNYTFRVETDADNDINTANDITETELVVVDSTATGDIELSYVVSDEQIGANDLISWQGAENFNDGLALYFKPPFYPIEISSLEFLVRPAGGQATVTSGFSARIVAEHADGSPNPTLVLSENILPAAFIIPEGGWHTITLAQPVQLNEGGFYVAWLMEGTNIALAVDVNPPFSRQTYEVLSGTWAPYRSKSTQDYFIKAHIRKLPGDSSIAVQQPALPVAAMDAYPNPATEQLNVRYTLHQPTEVNFTLTNVLGQTVVEKQLGLQSVGTYQLQCPVQALPPGIYQYTLQVRDERVSKKVVVKP